GTTARLANNEIGVTRWKYQRMNGRAPIQAASDTDAAPQSHSSARCIERRTPRSSARGRNGSGSTQRRKKPENGSANKTMAATTAKESWKPAANNSFVSQQRRINAAAARLLRRKTFRSKSKPPTRRDAMTAARRLGTCNPVIAA